MSNADKLMGLPNLVSVRAYGLVYSDMDLFPSQVNGLIDQAIEIESLSYFCLMAGYRDGDIQTGMEIKDIRIDKLWDAHIYDGILQDGLHVPRKDSDKDTLCFRTYEESYSNWSENRLGF